MDINEIRTLAGLPPVAPQQAKAMEQKEVPSHVTTAIKKRIKECDAALDSLSEIDADDNERKRQLTIREFLIDLGKKLDGTAHGFKMAQHLYTSAMSVIGHEVPGDVVTFLADDVQATLNHHDLNKGSLGNNRKQLRDYMTGQFTK